MREPAPPQPTTVAESPEDRLDRPCSLAEVDALAAAGLVDRDAAVSRWRAGPDAGIWRAAADVGLLFAGAILLAAAVVYVVAFNWAALGRFGQGGLIAAMLAASGVVATLRHPTPAGSAALVGAQILVGALFAWIGQTYQLGADPYTLFLAWAALTLPWAIAGTTNLLWLAQGLLWNTALALYAAQVLALDAATMPLMATLNLAFWGVSARFGPRWLGHVWLVVLVALHATDAALWIFGKWTFAAIAPGAAIAAATAGLAAYFGRSIPGVWTIAATGLFVEVCCVEARGLVEVAEALDAEFLLGSLLFTIAGGLALAQTAGLHRVLRSLNQRFHEGSP